MTFFGILRDSPMAFMFILVTLFNVFYGWRVFRGVGQGWSALNREPLRPEQKQLIDRAAFFLGIPLGVIIHEFGHALTVWLFGGQVVDAGYGLYWGYVSHIGSYTPSQLWIIAMAGTIGSLLYGVTMWLIFRRIPFSTEACICRQKAQEKQQYPCPPDGSFHRISFSIALIRSDSIFS